MKLCVYEEEFKKFISFPFQIVDFLVNLDPIVSSLFFSSKIYRDINSLHVTSDRIRVTFGEIHILLMKIEAFVKHEGKINYIESRKSGIPDRVIRS